MATLETYLQTAVDNIDYDIQEDRSKAVLFVGALRKVVLLRPTSVSIAGNPVAFSEIQSMLQQAESWLTNHPLVTAGSNNGGSTAYYDTSNIRGYH